MKYTLDRFEGDLAVLEAEDRTAMTVSRAQLPMDAKPGDVLLREEDRFAALPEETERRRQRIREKMRSLWK